MRGFPHCRQIPSFQHEMKQSAPNYLLFRLKVELGSSLAVRPNTNKQPSEVDTALDLPYSIPDSTLTCWPAKGDDWLSPSVSLLRHPGLWLLHLQIGTNALFQA